MTALFVLAGNRWRAPTLRWYDGLAPLLNALSPQFTDIRGVSGTNSCNIIQMSTKRINETDSIRRLEKKA
jgi:hypothetical protein